jgi:hypothetical protein
MPEEVVFFDLYRLGDQIYNLSLACALREAGLAGKLVFVTTKAVRNSPLPELLNFTRVEIPAPWLEPNWHRRPFALFGAALAFRAQSRSWGTGAIGLDPRSGFVEHCISSFGRELTMRRYHGSMPRSRAMRFLGYHNRHIYETRSEFLSEIRKGAQGLIAWPYLNRLFGSTAKHGRILLCPEASMVGKEWPIEYWLDLDERLAAEGIETVTVISADGGRFAPYRRKFREPWSGSIRDLGHLIAGSLAVIAVDSFPGHFAAAIGIPVLSLFGPTDPAIWRPWGANNSVLRVEAASQVKFSRAAIAREGPELMTSLSPDFVLSALKSWLVNAKMPCADKKT